MSEFTCVYCGEQNALAHRHVCDESALQAEIERLRAELDTYDYDPRYKELYEAQALVARLKGKEIERLRTLLRDAGVPDWVVGQEAPTDE